jgi:hypothetical protein
VQGIGFLRFLSQGQPFSPAAIAGIIMPTKPTFVELDMSKLEDALRRAEGKLDEQDYAMLKALADSYACLSELVGDKNTTIARLRKLLFGAKTEKTAAVIAAGKDSQPCSPPEAVAGGAKEGTEETTSAATAVEPLSATVEKGAVKTPRQDHGRNGVAA